MPLNPVPSDATLPVIKDGDPVAMMRLQLCDLLPRAMRNAVTSYQDFAAQTAPPDAKNFIAHHNACRAALAHLDALNKLGKWLVAHHPKPAEHDNLGPLLLEARRVLTQLDGACDAEDEDEPGETEF